MMNLVLFAVMAVAVCVNAAVVNPAEVEDSVAVFESETPVEYGEVIEPGAVEKPGFVFEYRAVEDEDISARNRLLFSNNYRKNAISNAVQVQTITVRFNANIRISNVRVSEVGASQNAMAHIIDGGVNRSFVVIRLTSARGRGYNFNVHLYGR